MLFSTGESNDALVAPLLLTTVDAQFENSAVDSGFNNIGMELSGGRLNYRRILTRWAQMKTLSDSLPGFLQVIVNNGKAASLGAVALYAVFLLIWLPIWILSFFTGEWGIYVLSICLIMIAGRSFIRMIAFPGASARVTLEIEAEFARYSVRMIVAATNSLLELATAIDQARNIDIVGHWHAAKQYRDHVLGVYYDVLQALLQQSSSASQLSDPDLTIYGNNRLKGDIGDLSCLTVRTPILFSSCFCCHALTYSP